MRFFAKFQDLAPEILRQYAVAATNLETPHSE